MNRKQLAVTIVLVLLVFASNRLFRQQESRPVSTATGEPVPDAFAENVQLDIMNRDGKRIYQIHASTMEYFPDTDRLQFQQPRLELTRHSDSHWLLLAESGYTAQDGDPVWLQGKVTIQQLDAGSGVPLRIETSDVLVKPGARLAETAQAASITGNGYQLDTNGFSADFNNNRLELHSRVRGRLNGAS